MKWNKKILLLAHTVSKSCRYLDYSEGYSGISCQLEKKVKVRVVFLSATWGSPQTQWPLRKFAHPRQKQLSCLEICFSKSLPIFCRFFASPSNLAAHDKAHSQVLMLHLSMHFNPVPVLKFIAGKQNLPFQTHIVNAPGMDEFLC